ncbi:MAG: ribosome recycling factor [Clostridia bacterium]|nr:ribosome recycling factor [Clostridia bacterium]
MEVLELLDGYESALKKAVDSYKTHILNIRAGRANPHILDKVMVDYYGTPTPLNQMGSITVPEAKMIVVSIWDGSALKAAEKAIIDANVGITPNNDGKVIRLVFPDLTEERRQALVKELKQTTENAKVALRNHRRDANEGLKKLKKDSLITEDDVKALEKDVDKLLNDYLAGVEKAFKDKESEILSV